MFKFALFVLMFAAGNSYSADEDSKKLPEDPYTKFVKKEVERQKEAEDKLFRKVGVKKDFDDSKVDADKVCWGKNTADSVKVCR